MELPLCWCPWSGTKTQSCARSTQTFSAKQLASICVSERTANPGKNTKSTRQDRKLNCFTLLHRVKPPLDFKGNYSVMSNNTKLVHWPLMGGLLHLVQRGGAWVGCGPAQQSPPRCTKCNSPPINGQCTNHCIAMFRCSAVSVWRLKA